ncbi:MAG: hypothetical protein F6K63_35840 [Moorea sp. SIO1G6]|uniref:hypothetical protein n=1 Tax=unclassified Moorena TaxID=2683338 RepID=UPI0013BAA394|nr:MULTISPECIES: hypothetical protein [unclassified Moorena]NEQ05606.1 hypothetical protein [Moorena sp. SIO4E2]NET69456.1 hypothetical protein [Moorena sp. SIO1G6]
MEPTTIVTALTAGLAAVGKGTASQAGQDIYQGLKGLLALIKKKFTGNQAAEMVLAEYENDPKICEKLLERKLLETNANQDEEIVRAAQKLMNIINSQQTAMGGDNVSIGKIGKNVGGFVIGKNAQIRNRDIK